MKCLAVYRKFQAEDQEIKEIKGSEYLISLTP